VLNCGVGRRRLFDKTKDFEAFEEVLTETLMTGQCGFAAFV
jgi:hypothetical protein